MLLVARQTLMAQICIANVKASLEHKVGATTGIYTEVVTGQTNMLEPVKMRHTDMYMQQQ